MFDSQIYQQRRRQLKDRVSQGLILLLGHVESPFNSAGNCYPFRQDSSFLYFCGLDYPGLALVLDADSGVETLYGPEVGLEDEIWSGRLATLAELGRAAGIAHSASMDALEEAVAKARSGGRKVHFLPSCRGENRIEVSRLLGIDFARLESLSSPELIRAVVDLRSTKGAEEIEELDAAADLGRELHLTAMEMAEPGLYEWEIAGALAAVAARAGRMLAFPPIVTVRGEVLHNHQRDNQLQKGQLLLVDAGVESERHYASDHTRTFPVSSRFETRQRDIYSVVLSGVENARQMIRPGVNYVEVHLAVCATLVEGLKALGLMKGDTDEAVAEGAHALFMPHGLGHMLGLDVHDMEDLGEDFVGYDEQTVRSQQFGTSRLRLGRELKEHFALTVEPGIYFIPALIKQWQAEGRCKSFINYSALSDYHDFGGIRLEDDVLVTASGNRLIGSTIPLQPEDVEKHL